MMKDKYRAKRRYSIIDPTDYEIQRFRTPAGKLIDDLEKKTVLKLLLSSGIDNKRGLKILDVATGPGRLAFYLENHLKKAEITGVDINENMLRQAKQRAKEKMSRVKFIKGDIYHLPFINEQFNAVVGLRFSMHLPQIDKLMKELSRILENGSILIFDIFNYQSLLKLKLPERKTNKEDCGLYTIEEIIQIAKSHNFEFLEYRGILFFGETLLRKFPDKLLFLLSPLINPPKYIERFSAKLVLCFKKRVFKI